MQNSFFTVLFLFVVFVMINACSSGNSYERMVQRGLQSGVQNDSLFLGYYFGMSSDDFHSHSWEMNQNEIITGLVTISHTFDDLQGNANMDFFPTFVDGKIARIPVNVEYVAWAPWNQQFWPDQLIEDLIVYYGDLYGASFQSVYIPEIERFAQVAIQGNREIRMYQNSESGVLVDFIDLNVYGHKE